MYVVTESRKRRDLRRSNWWWEVMKWKENQKLEDIVHNTETGGTAELITVVSHTAESNPHQWQGNLSCHRAAPSPEKPLSAQRPEWTCLAFQKPIELLLFAKAKRMLCCPKWCGFVSLGLPYKLSGPRQKPIQIVYNGCWYEKQPGMTEHLRLQRKPKLLSSDGLNIQCSCVFTKSLLCRGNEEDSWGLIALMHSSDKFLTCVSAEKPTLCWETFADSPFWFPQSACRQ